MCGDGGGQPSDEGKDTDTARGATQRWIVVVLADEEQEQEGEEEEEDRG